VQATHSQPRLLLFCVLFFLLFTLFLFLQFAAAGLVLNIFFFPLGIIALQRHLFRLLDGSARQ
jgi:hypothetical protein